MVSSPSPLPLFLHTLVGSLISWGRGGGAGRREGRGSRLQNRRGERCATMQALSTTLLSPVLQRIGSQAGWEGEAGWGQLMGPSCSDV